MMVMLVMQSYTDLRSVEKLLGEAGPRPLYLYDLGVFFIRLNLERMKIKK